MSEIPQQQQTNSVASERNNGSAKQPSTPAQTPTQAQASELQPKASPESFQLTLVEIVSDSEAASTVIVEASAAAADDCRLCGRSIVDELRVDCFKSPLLLQHIDQLLAIKVSERPNRVGVVVR